MEIELIQSKIIEVRQQKVLTDRDLATMYGVTTFNLNKAVKRNIERFPSDFMFQLSKEEFNLIFQNGMSSWGGTRRPPYVFTELGVAMLSSVLNSKIAIQVNISVMRAFTLLRQYALNYAEINHKLENFMVETNMQFSEIYAALIELAEQKKIEEKPRGRIGFGVPLEEIKS